MAFQIEAEKRGLKLMRLLGILILFGALGTLTYYLFFAPTPFIETILPPDLETIAQISAVEFDASLVTNSPVYKKLTPKISDPGLGAFGRPNPFLPYSASPK